MTQLTGSQALFHTQTRPQSEVPVQNYMIVQNSVFAQNLAFAQNCCIAECSSEQKGETLLPHWEAMKVNFTVPSTEDLFA